jgi:putative copper export protein/mono/diheme cytochrome c family protein
MDLQSLVAGSVHALGLASLSAAIGGLILELLVVPANLNEKAILSARLQHWITIWLVVLTLATLADLVIRTQTISRAPLAVAFVTLPDVVKHTHFGAILAVRSAGLALAVLLSIAQSAPLRFFCLLITVAITLTTSLTGHAADWGDLTFYIAVDWAHVVAASAWTGGLFALAWIILRQRARLHSVSVALIARRFSRLAAVCLVTVVLTGIYNAWSQLEVFSRLWTTVYGRLLLVKLVLAAGLVWFGAVNRYVIIPRLDPNRRTDGIGTRLFRILRLVWFGARRRTISEQVPSQLSRYVTWEALLAFAVFASTAALGEATPARHTAFERKVSSHVTPVEPRSGGNSSSLGTVTPPQGDVGRGRALFVKLQCFTCHAVKDDGSRVPSQPGPSLAEVGRRHPGYLVESIVNPNAMILDGPGYTDSRGLSIMPDYRNKLTVGDLIDLVAYLKTL